MPKFIDLSGQMFGFLYAIERDLSHRGRNIKYICRCAKCGNVKSILAQTLRNPNVIACGCMTSRNGEHLKNVNKNTEKANQTRKEKYLKYNTDLRQIGNDTPHKDSSTGVRGVFFNEKLQNYQARIRFRGVSYYLGCFDDIITAEKAVKEKRRELHSALMEDKHE